MTHAGRATQSRDPPYEYTSFPAACQQERTGDREKSIAMQLNGRPHYRLASHVHACLAGAHVVFLDLKRDRYLGFAASDAAVLQDRVAGLPPTTPSASVRSESPPRAELIGEETASIVEQLHEHGMLEQWAGHEDQGRMLDLERPQQALIDGYVDVPFKTNLRDVWNFVVSSATAAILIRRRSLQRIVERVGHRRSALASTDFDLENARQRLAMFNALRPMLLSESRACLFISVIIGEFLARYGIYPHFVFGVAMDPFRAHCWLQHGGVIINDAPEYVREYTPILIA